MNKIQLLKPEARTLFENFTEKLEKRGFRYSILETLRKKEIQEAYYAQGRVHIDEVNRLRIIAGIYPLPVTDKNGNLISYNIITSAVHSPHQDGYAGDIVPVIDDKGTIPWVITGENAELWLEFGKLGQEAGLEWGGTWKPLNRFGIGWDAPHYQYSGAV
jgi:hypothetical protein